MISNSPSDTPEHFQHNRHGHYDDADLTASTTGSITVSSAMGSTTMQINGAHSGMHPSPPGLFAMRTMVGTSPPPLPRIVPVALPSLSPNIPIQFHALIIHRPSTSPIYWNVSFPPPSALLAIANSGTSSRWRWSRDVAVVPNVSSFTIRVRGVARPIVVFPVQTGLPIRIIDILRAVYNAMRAEALENGTGASDVSAHGANGQGSRRDLASDDAIAAGAIRRRYGNRVWWNGLSQSTTEVDVWVLHLRGPSRGRYRWYSARLPEGP